MALEHPRGGRRVGRAAPYACLIAVALFGASARAHDPARATYLGNEGVLVARGDTKVLFDAFYADGYGEYALVPDETADSLLTDKPPYDGIDAIFVSHVHGDHFTAAPAIAYLRAHPGVKLYGPPQVRAAFLAAGIVADDAMMAQIVSVDAAPGDAPRVIEVGDLAIDAYAIAHVGGAQTAAIQHIAFLVTLDQATSVIHLGDADPAESHYIPYQADFDRRAVDAAFPPYWFLTDPEGRLVLERRLKARQVIGVHVPARAAGEGEAWREEAGGDLFTDPGETRDIGGGPVRNHESVKPR